MVEINPNIFIFFDINNDKKNENIFYHIIVENIMTKIDKSKILYSLSDRRSNRLSTISVILNGEAV